MSKKRRLGPFLGKTHEWTNELEELLNALLKQPQFQLENWITVNFHRVKSARVVEDRIRTLESLDLFIQTGNGNYLLTPEGLNFLETHDKMVIFKALEREYEGITETVEILRYQPLKVQDINDNLKRAIDSSWKKNGQCIVRLNWLQAVGIVKKSGNYYSLNEENSMERSEVTVSETLTHQEMQVKLLQLGKDLKWVAEKEYKIPAGVLDVVWKNIEDGVPIYAFEIQNRGNISDALRRLKTAHIICGTQLLFLIVTDEKDAHLSKVIIRTSFSEISHLISVVFWSDITLYGKNRSEVKLEADRLKIYEKRYRRWQRTAK